MGLKSELWVRVRIERPKELQATINAARTAEWEENYAKPLKRRILGNQINNEK